MVLKNWANSGKASSLSPGWHQAIAWANNDLFIWIHKNKPLRNYDENTVILYEKYSIQNVIFKTATIFVQASMC